MWRAKTSNDGMRWKHVAVSVLTYVEFERKFCSARANTRFPLPRRQGRLDGEARHGGLSTKHEHEVLCFENFGEAPVRLTCRTLTGTPTRAKSHSINPAPCRYTLHPTPYTLHQKPYTLRTHRATQHLTGRGHAVSDTEDHPLMRRFGRRP